MSNGSYGFANPRSSPDDFNTFSPQDVFADSKIHVAAVAEKIPAPWRTPPVMSLDEVLGKTAVQQIRDAGQIVFHSVGDTGGIHNPAHQFAVADAMATDLAGKDYKGGRPAFFFHLGDIVYYFGQEHYYFDQFYDPYRNYDAPIFAIPGNHDGVMFPKEPVKFSLEPFWNIFCTKQPGHNLVAQSCTRTTLTQPGVYFTLDAPFLKIIGLYSNTSEIAGMLSGQAAGVLQRDFLAAQLKAAAAQRQQKVSFALIIAVHHPPFTGSSGHFPSPGMLAEIDAAAQQAGIQPDLVLSGHAHLYERYTRSLAGRKIPYVVAGCGGYYNLSGFKKGKNGAPARPTVPGTDGKGNPLTLEAFHDGSFGFVRLTVSATSILGEFMAVNEQTGATSAQDSFTLDLNKHDVTTNSKKQTAPKKAAAAKKTTSVSFAQPGGVSSNRM